MYKTNWNLEEILKYSNFENFSLNFQEKLGDFEKQFSSLSSNMSKAGFIKIVDSYIKITEQINIIYARAYLSEELDSVKEEGKFLRSKANNCLIEYQNAIRPFQHWLKGLEKLNGKLLTDQTASELFESIPRLEYFFKRVRKLKHHTLGLKEEQIIANKDITGTQTLIDLRSIIDSEQKFRSKINGKIKKFNTSSDLAKFFKDKKRENRINSYNSLYKVYSENLMKYFSIYQAIVKDWAFEASLRKYDSNISVRNLANDIKDTTVDVLLDSCKQNQNIFNEFFDIKAKELKISKPTRYDIYAPTLKLEKKIDYSKGVEILLKVFREFDPELFEIAQRFFEKKQIDVYPKINKKSGAFCANITNKIEPYLLLNYTDTTRDVFILAHEFGHALHYILAQEQSVLTQDAPLTLAETASTFTENIVFDYLYKNEPDKQTKKAMLFEKITDAYATISRQANFVIFELEAHKLLNQGIKLEDFNIAYLKNLQTHFQDHVKVPEVFKYEWSYIPHIVNAPFYCYAYPFGNLLSFSLYENYLENDGSFVAKYKRILKAGGSVDPYILLNNEGFDINDPQFFNNGFKLIKNWVEELRLLVQ